MEASEAFTQETDGRKDPFDGSDFGDFGEPDPPIDAADLPVVDREGNRVEPVAEEGNGTESSPLQQEQPQETPAPPQPPAQVGPTPEAQAALDALKEDPTPPVESAGPTDEDFAAAALGTDETQVVPEPTTPGDGEVDPTASASPAASSDTPTGVESSVDSAVTSSNGAEEPEDAPEPEEIKDKNNRVTKRRYLIFQVDGPGKLSQVNWYEDAKGKLTQRGSGAKRQNVVLARGTEDALKFGYAAVGAPAAGAHLVAVAALHFQPKKIKPLPPEPMRQRLSIN